MVEQRWRIELFGGLRARCGERVVTHFESRKIAALFACLALRLQRSQSRELLAEQLWPEEEWDAIRNRLRQGLSSLRQTLEPGGSIENSVLLTDHFEAGLDATEVSTDVEDFEAALARAVSAGTRTTTNPKNVAIDGDHPLTVRIAFCNGLDGELIKFFQNEEL